MNAALARSWIDRRPECFAALGIFRQTVPIAGRALDAQVPRGVQGYLVLAPAAVRYLDQPVVRSVDPCAVKGLLVWANGKDVLSHPERKQF